MRKILFYSLVGIHFSIIIFFWWQTSGIQIGSSIANTYLSLGRLSGLVGASLILLQFILLGRTRFIEEVFGLDKLSKVHRLNGKVALCVILVHPVLLLLGYSITRSVSLLEQEIQFLTQFDDVLKASIGLIIFCGTVFLSLVIVRRKLKYEWWYGIHLFNYLALLLVFTHQWQLGEDFLANKLFTGYWLLLYTMVFLNFILFRILHQLYLFFRYQFYVDNVIKENGVVTSIIIGGKNLKRLKRSAGQFFLYRFLDKNNWWQEHPFSMSNRYDAETLRISAKDVGDFTHELPQLKKGTRVLIDGPFGVFTRSKATRKKFLLIAGGIGITPLRSLFEELSENKFDTTLLYICSTKDEITFEKELIAIAKKFGTRIIFILTIDASFKGEKGRLDDEKLRRLVPDVKKREVYVCGPVPMMQATIALVEEQGVQNQFIHYERFAL